MLALMAAALTSCPVEKARYVLRTQPDVTARFVDVASGPEWPAHLALGIHYAKSGRTYWWLPWNGGTNGQQNVASTTDVTARGWHAPSPDGEKRPLGSADFIGTDADYKIWDHVPEQGGAAPAHFFISTLSGAIWHGGGDNPRDGTARQFFDLTGCGA